MGFFWGGKILNLEGVGGIFGDPLGDILMTPETPWGHCEAIGDPLGWLWGGWGHWGPPWGHFRDSLETPEGTSAFSPAPSILSQSALSCRSQPANRSAERAGLPLLGHHGNDGRRFRVLIPAFFRAQPISARGARRNSQWRCGGGGSGVAMETGPGGCHGNGGGRA